jgi:hypothetical protein
MNDANKQPGWARVPFADDQELSMVSHTERNIARAQVTYNQHFAGGSI